jgi:antitoxin VapB
MSVRAKLFSSGRSQAVRLPKALRMPGDEVIAKPFGNGVLLLPLEDPWRLMREAVEDFEPGFEMVREQPPQQERDWSAGRKSKRA